MNLSIQKMTKLIPIFLIIASSHLFAQKSDEVAIKELVQKSFDAIFSGGQSPNISDYYTNDFLLLEHGEVWNNDTIQRYIERMATLPNIPKRTNSFDFIKIDVLGDRAYIAYHNYATISKDGEVLRKLYWLESGDLIRTENGWRMKLLHSTRVPKKD